MLWTGTDPSHNGIHGNTVIPQPYGDNTIIDSASAFHAGPLQAEPVWAAAARQGKKVVVVQATHAAPFKYYLGDDARFPAPEGNLLIFDGYIEGGLSDEVINEDIGFESAENWTNLPDHNGRAMCFSHLVGDTKLWFLLFDDPEDQIEGLDTVAVCSSADGSDAKAFLKPRAVSTDSAEHFSDAVEVTFDGVQGAAFFRLFQLSPDGMDMLLYRSRVYHQSCSDEEARVRMLQAGGSFVGNAAAGLYADGQLGKTCMDGGEGTAERRYLETVHLCMELADSRLKTGMTSFQWDLLISYTAFPDEALHEWLGYVAEPTGDAESDIGKEVWAYLLEVFELVDEHVGVALDNMPEDAILIIISDHGFAPADKIFYPNTVLRQAGLLKLNEDGEVDLGSTKALYFPGNNDFVMINTPRFKGGWVSEEQVHDVRQEVMQALLEARTEDGKQPVVGCFDPDSDAELGMNGPYAGDVYLKLAPGFYPGGSLERDELSRKVKPFGMHQGDPRNRMMQSIFLMGGEPVKRRSDLGQIRAVDVAPSICFLLGIDPPRNATGKPVNRMLELFVSREESQTIQ